MYIYPLEKTRAATACAGPLQHPHFDCAAAMCATAEGAHTEDSVVTDVVFQLLMFALNAEVEENACEPTTRGPHRTAPRPSMPPVQ